jgi:hypothetical protein
MTTSPVFCPKCGQQSTEGLRFCSRCGTNLEAVSKVLTGQLPALSSEAVRTEAELAFAKQWSRAIGSLVTSIAVFTAMMIIFGKGWVWFLLFWVVFAVRDVVQAYLLRRTVQDPAALKAALEVAEDGHGRKRKRRRERRRALEGAPEAVPLTAPRVPEPVKSTGELEEPARDWEAAPPPSVTESTTRHLEDKDPRPPRYAPPGSE